MKGEVECDEELNIACMACNVFPNGQSQELAFFSCLVEMHISLL